MLKPICFSFFIASCFAYSGVLLTLDGHPHYMSKGTGVSLGRCPSISSSNSLFCDQEVFELRDSVFNGKWAESEWSLERISQKINFYQRQEKELLVLLEKSPQDNVLLSQLVKVKSALKALQNHRELSDRAFQMLTSSIEFDARKNNVEMQPFLPVFEEVYRLLVVEILSSQEFLLGKWGAALPIQPSGEKVNVIYEFWRVFDQKRMRAYFEWENGRASSANEGYLGGWKVKGTRLTFSLRGTSALVAVGQINKKTFIEYLPDGSKRIFRRNY